VGPRNDIDKTVTSELTSYNQALRSFRSLNWDRAEVEFSNLNQSNPGRKLYQIYLDRITHFRAAPPADDWDGVFDHTSK